MRAELADGRILEFPDGTDPQVIQATVKKMIAGDSPTGQPTTAPQPQPTHAPAPQAQPPQQEQGMGFGEFIEPMAALATGALAEPIAGIAGIAQSINPWAEQGAGEKAIESTREALTYQPRGQEAQKVLGEVGGLAEPAAELATDITKGMGDYAFELTGSPAIATLAASTPAAIVELLGLKGLKSIRKGTPLRDATGRPTKRLRKALDKQGLDYDSLNPEVQELIPDVAEPRTLPGANPVKEEVEQVIKEQLKAGARDDALSGLKLEGEKVVIDKAGRSAVKQGFTDGFVQSVKTSSKATKAKMMKMSRMMRGIKKQERLGLKHRPSDVVGDSVTERIIHIRESANAASKELNEIARKKLPGVEVDTSPVIEALQSALGDLDVELIESAKRGIKPKFEGSLISKDRASQRVINDLVSLMSEGGAPDALRFHKLKRQLDIMIDFNKKSAHGLTDAGKKVLKKMRASLNDSLRSVNPDYARVNDVLSSSLGAINDIDKAVGTIDIFGEGASSAIGTKMRALLSNQQGRVRLENALNQIEEVATKLGGKFEDDIKDLIMFADGLDAKFGTSAKTSFSGQIEQAVSRAATTGPKSSVVDAVGKRVGKGAEKLRGINDFNAFESLEELLK